MAEPARRSAGLAGEVCADDRSGEGINPMGEAYVTSSAHHIDHAPTTEILR